MKKITLKKLRNPQKWITQFLVLFVLLGNSAIAQTTVTLGSGTTTSVDNSTGSGMGPVNGYYAYMRYQVVYTAAEITAAGGSAGYLTQFGWNVATVPGSLPLPDYKVRMATTSATDSATHNAAALTEVYSAAFNPVTGFNMFTLTTPFLWDGTSNILIDVCFGPVGFVSPYGQVYTYGTTANSSRYARSDGSSRCGSDTGQVNAFKPQARFVISPPPSCFPPSALQSSAVTAFGANVSWTAPATAPGSGYEYYVSTTNTAPTAATTPTGSVATGTTATIGSLNPTTVYYVWVRGNCGAADKSIWTGPATFTTLPTCFPPTAITLSAITTVSATASWTAPATVPFDGYEYYLSTSATAPTAATVPTGSSATTSANLTLTANTAYNLWVRGNCGAADKSAWSAAVSFVSECDATTVPYAQNFEAVTTPAMPECTSAVNVGTGNNWTTASPSQSGFTTKVLNYTFNSTNPANAWFYLRGITLTAGVSYRLSYKYGNNGGTTYVEKMKVAYGTSKSVAAMTNQLADHPNIVNNTTPITNVIDFIPATTGVYYIGFNVYSATDRNRLFVDDISLDVTPSCLPPTALQVSNVGETTATATWTASTTTPSNGYQYYLATTNTAPTATTTPTGTVAAGVLTKALTGLNVLTNYYLWVRSDCGTGVTSAWTPAATFTTLCDAPDITATTGGTVCGQGTPTLTATISGGIAEWYAAATGGTALATGTSFTTPVISTTTNYYVQAVSQGNAFVGATYSGTSNNGTNTGGHGIMVTTTKANRVINTVDIPFTGTGTFTLSLLDADSEEEVTSVTTVSVTGNGTTPVTVPVNLTIATPGEYILLVDGITGDIGALGYSSGSYPYATNDGGFVITSGYWWGQDSTNMYLYNLNVTAGCPSPRTMVTATVTPTTAVTAAASVTTICAGQSTNLSVTSANAGYSYTWMPGNLTGAAQTVSPTTTTTYTVTATETQGTTTCTTVSSVTVTVNPLPTTIVTNANVTVCEGSTQLLTSTGGVATTTIYQENFEALPATFTASSADASVTANSTYFAQGAGSVLFNTGNDADVNYAMNTNLSLVGYTSAVITFSHIAALEGAFTTYDAGYVEYSTDGGANWTTFSASDYYGSGTLITNQDPEDGIIFSDLSYTDWEDTFDDSDVTPGAGPATALWKNEEIHIPAAALGSSQFRLRFRITSDGSVSYYGWLIDNLKISGSAVQTIWSPVTNLYTNAAATVPYTGTPRSNVYTKPTGNITYTATAANPATSCSVSATVNVTMNSTASPTAAAAQNFCSSSTVASLVATGTNIQWYAAATGGTALAATTALVNGTTYYATQTVNGCQSFVRTAVAVTITNVVADDPADVTACNSYVLPALTNGAYYTGAGGTGTAHAAGDIITATTTLYVYASGGTNPVCTAENSFVVTVNVTPVPTANAGQNFCNSATVADLDATGTGIQWYAAATGGTALATDMALVSGTTYYGSQTIGTCESATRVAVVANITTVEADAPADVAVCNSYTLPALTSGNYFTGSGGTGTAHTAGDVITSTTTLYVYAVGSPNPLCTDENSFTVTINSAATPEGAAVQNVCNSGTLADLDVTGDAIQWYADATGGTALAGNTALVNGSTYYATQTVGVCESVVRKAVTVGITTVDADAPADVTACNSYTLPALLSGNYFTGAGGTGDALEPGDILTATATVYVYATAGTNPVCSAENSFVVTINTVETPSGDAVQTITVTDVSEATIEDLQASGNGSISWYASEQDAIAGTNPLPAGTVVISGNTYYASQMVGECMSPTALAVTVDVVLGDKNFDIRSFSYYPNPVVNVLNLTYSSEITSVTVFNLLGQQVMAKQPNTTEVKLDMSGLAEGAYVINVRAGDFVKTIKVVKRH